MTPWKKWLGRRRWHGLTRGMRVEKGAQAVVQVPSVAYGLLWLYCCSVRRVRCCSDDVPDRGSSTVRPLAENQWHAISTHTKCLAPVSSNLSHPAHLLRILHEYRAKCGDWKIASGSREFPAARLGYLPRKGIYSA